MKYTEPMKVIEKFNYLRGQRGMWESLWQDLADFIQPRKDEVQFSRVSGERKFVNLLDSTAMTNNELLAGALHGMLTNPSGYFFNLSTGSPELDKKDAVRKWIQATVRVIHDTLNNTNFQTEVHEVYLDLGGFGTACMFVDEDKDTHIRFSTKPLKEIFADENSKGVIDCVYRCFEMDARGIVEDFGKDGKPDGLPKKIVDAFKGNKPTKFEIIHAVYPQQKGKDSNKVFKFVSQYIFVAEKVNLDVQGYRENPYLVPRWSKISGEVYGRGPGEKALPSAKTLNVMRETVLKGAQKVVDPPLQAPDDGFITQVDTRPAGISYYRAGSDDRIAPIFADTRLDFGFQAIDQERLQVREAFYSDQLKLREGPQMTAKEVEERVEQALRFLGPMLGRQQFEFLQPLIERVYAILDRKGLIPPVPAELADKPLKIQYSSVMAMSQRLSELGNIQRTMQNIAPFASSDPTVLDNINGDAAVKFIGGLLNFPQEMIRDKGDVEQMRKQRAELQQQQLQAEQQMNMADGVSKVMGAAAKTKAGA